jgi:hypothetical protein
MPARSAHLAAGERERLIRLLGMLGSAYDGEVTNAGRIADRLVRAAGLTWPDLIPPALESPSPDPLRAVLRDWPERWRDAVQVCLEAEARLADWDRRFIHTIAAYQHRPSPRQIDILQTIFERLSGGAS